MDSRGNVESRQASEREEKVITVTDEIIESRLCEYLKKRELPDYLLYTGVGEAKNWLNLDGSGTFPAAQHLKVLLEKNIASIGKFIPAGMSLVSIGVGNGEKERIILQELIRKNLAENPSSEKLSLRYYPVDINSQFVDIALEKVRNLPVEKKGIVGFIEETPVFKKFWRLPVLFCILGNTFCNYEPEFILQLTYENLEQGDLFFFDANLLPAQSSGMEAQSAKRSVLGTYASRENALFNMYPLLQYGMIPEDFDFELLLSHEESKMGALYRTRKSLNILNDSEIRIGQETISFREGDVIKMGFTYIYTYEQIIAFLKMYGFEVLKAFLSEDRANAIILAKKSILGTGEAKKCTRAYSWRRTDDSE